MPPMPVRALALSVLVPLTLLAACVDTDDPLDGDPVVDGGGGATTPTTTSDTPATPLPAAVTAVLDLPATPYRYGEVVLPAAYQTPAVRAQDNTPADNRITDNGATLGRVLFYDRALSANRTIACASCHDQAHAFADPARFSTGFDGSHGTRNAPAVTDARFYRRGRFFWDERAATLEAQVLMPIQNPIEMGLTLDELVTRVRTAPYYAYLFQRAFGDSDVTSDRIARALAQFSRSLVSYRSRYDVGLAATGDARAPFPAFTAEENQGKQLFLGRANCGSCHLFNGPPQPGPLANQAVFFVDIPTNNGLDATTAVADTGVGGQTGQARDLGRFKSPSLRNVAVTAPYMHDGRLATLADVVEHYRRGVQPHPNLDRRLMGPDGTPRRLDLTDAEARALVAFLRTLTDDALLRDPWFANPFR
jgi:cytochrome c peroxidase